MTYLLWWLVITIPCFFVYYANTMALDLRLKEPEADQSLFSYLPQRYGEAFRFFIHDFFGVFCPWSWGRAKKFRLSAMRIHLGEAGRNHDQLGQITSADCDIPERQEEIARHTFISRAEHWRGSVIPFLISPLVVVLIIISNCFEIIAELWHRLRKK